MAWAVVGSYALKVFKVQVGYFILFILTYLGVRNIKKLRIFLASLVLYHCFIIVVNVDKLSSTARIGSFKAGYFLGDGNDFAWSLTIFLPFLIYLFITTKRSILRTIILSAMGMFIAAMVGTGSRGAFLALSASIVYLVFNSRKKAKAIVVTTALALLVFAFAPSSYMDRIHSIGEYQEDSSALGRMMAWKASMRMAVGHPLGVGAGNFNSAYGRFYRPTEVDPRIWGGARWISPHSVYFLVLGEYGVIGLVTLLTLLGLNFRDNQHQIANLNSKSVRPTLGDNVETLPKYLNMSLMAFAAGGAFLGGINYPHIYILTALILRTKKINEEVTQAGENLKPA
jgi:probable O-glycosylation ligase (exosortase A-associated)